MFDEIFYHGLRLVFIVLGIVVIGRYILAIVEDYTIRRRFAISHGTQAAKDATRGIGIRDFYQTAVALKNDTLLQFMFENHRKVEAMTFLGSLLGTKNIVTCDPENIKAVLATNFSDFVLGQRSVAFEPTLGRGIFTLDGTGWSHSRALLRPQFARSQVSDTAMFEQHVERLIAALPRSSNVACDIQKLFFRFTLDAATDFLFGESVDSLRLAEQTLDDKQDLPPPAISPKSGDRKRSISKARMTVLGYDTSKQGFAAAFNEAQMHITFRVLLQGFSWIYSPPSYRRANMTVHNFVDYYVNRALENYQLGKSTETIAKRYVFLDALVQDTQDPQTLRDQLLNILLAGRDTTALLLSAAIMYISRDSSLYRKLRQVILDRFGSKPGTPGKMPMTFENLKSTILLRNVLNETLRLCPSVPQNFRIACRDTVLPRGGGSDESAPLVVRKGQYVFYSVYVLQRWPEIWGDDADMFRPERWDALKGQINWEFVPFNGGPRICLGQQFALTEAGYTLARLAQTFESVSCADPNPEEYPKIRAFLTSSLVGGVNVKLKFAS
ncbi:cytochrome P450 [Lipomyces oligophaga]|uniref:cytochrome P450 n=1 Tax=Lipomyces oligophaga TaxID=45792 RepID=UPI0034CDB526